MIKKVIAVMLVIVNLLVLSSCGADKGIDVPDFDFSSEKVNVVNDIDDDTTLDDTIKYASEVKNVAQSYYSNTDRTKYVMKNKDMTKKK